MAEFRRDPAHPDASTKGVNMIVSIYDKGGVGTAVSKNGKATNLYNLDVAVNQEPGANPNLRPQYNEHLHTSYDKKSGQFSNTTPYYESQMGQIMEAAGQNTQPILDKDGEKIGNAFAVKANVMFKGRQAIMDTKSLEPSDVELQPNWQDVQFQTTQVNNEVLKPLDKQTKEGNRRILVPASGEDLTAAVAQYQENHPEMTDIQESAVATLSTMADDLNLAAEKEAEAQAQREQARESARENSDVLKRLQGMNGPQADAPEAPVQEAPAQDPRFAALAEENASKQEMEQPSDDVEFE